MENEKEHQPPPSILDSKSSLSVWKAILVGWLWVNIPALVIMLSAVLVGIKIVPVVWWLFFLMGFIVGWGWWSYTIPRWRRWAHKHGILPDVLQKAAVTSGLTWPRGSFMEKTEFKIDD